MSALGFFVVFLVVAVSGLCQQSQQDSSASLLHKTVFLRGLWLNDTLRFDAEGHLKDASPTTTPLASGMEITKVDLKKNRLVLAGQRMSAIYENGSLHMEEMRKPMHVEIAVPASGDYRLSLEAVFAPDLAALKPDVPEHWEPCLTGEITPSDEDGPEKRKADAGTVEAPTLLFAPETSLADCDRSRPIHSVILVGLTIDRCGSPRHVAVLQGTGTFVDEKAVETVRRYRFKPAMKDGHPVAVELHVEVRLDIG